MLQRKFEIIDKVIKDYPQLENVFSQYYTSCNRKLKKILVKIAKARCVFTSGNDIYMISKDDKHFIHYIESKNGDWEIETSFGFYMQCEKCENYFKVSYDENSDDFTTVSLDGSVRIYTANGKTIVLDNDKTYVYVVD